MTDRAAPVPATDAATSAAPSGWDDGAAAPPPSTAAPSGWAEGDTRPPENARADGHRPPAWVVGTAVGVAYTAIGLLSLLIAIPPGYASPLYPAAGLALAAVLVHGLPALAGVVLGAAAVNAAVALSTGGAPGDALIVPAGIALGAGAQALAGAAWVRRWVGQPLTLTEPRDIARFFAVAVVSCGISATAATAVLGLTGTVSRDALAVTFATWWSGDALGVLIGAPIVLTLIGLPRGAWANRRRTVGLAMALATLVMTLAIVQADRWNRAADRQAFDREADGAARAVERIATDATQLADAAAVLVADAAAPAPALLGALATPWLGATSAVDTLRWWTPAPAGRERAGSTFVLRASAPVDTPAAAHEDPGTPDAVAALARARASGQAAAVRPSPAAAVPGRLTLVRAAPAAAGASARMDNVVTVTLRLDRLAAAATDVLPPRTQACLVPAGADRAAHATCLPEAPATIGPRDRADPPSTRAVRIADSDWTLHLRPPALGQTGFREANVWLFAMIGLAGNAMFGALMLTVTGRTRRIQVAVKARTAQLEAQVRERERTERALRDSEQRFRNILNTVPIGVLYTDLDGRVRQANPKFHEMLGWSAAELQHRRAQDLTAPEDREAEAVLLAQLVSGETRGYRLRKRFIARDGRAVWVQAVVTALRDEHGEPRRIVGVAEDITEQLRLAEAERARQSAEAANHAKSDFLSRMSHELRTPLNAMLGFAQLLEMDTRTPLAPSQRPWVTQIQQAGWHLLEMINDVLDLSRIEAGTLRLDVRDLDLAELLEGSRALVMPDAGRRGITLSSTVEPAAARVRGDPTRVKQVLANLLSNAVKYNVDGGRVQAIARRAADRGHVEIAVTDTGLGMTPEQLRQLFQPFNRLGRERSGREGTGIGLVISQRLAELMGGGIAARSVAGEGSTFVLRLPLATATVPTARSAAPVAVPAHDYHRRRVLYIEDNETNVEVMRGILAQRPQVDLLVAMTGGDGLLALRGSAVDLVLLDLHLPDVDGLEVLRRVKGDPALADVPVVAVSADATPQSIEATIAAGACGYLTKPVGVADLLHTVDRLLDAADTAFG